MPSTTNPSPPNAIGSGLDRLEQAFRRVLGESFEVELRALVEGSRWYHSELPSAEVFRLWVCDSIEAGGDPEWVFQPVRANERKFLCDELGIARTEVIGRNPRQVAGLIMFRVGLPGRDLVGVESIRGSWQEVLRLIDAEEDERAAVLCRQRGERLLRELLVFYCGIGYSEYFVNVLRDPGNLRVPAALQSGVTGATDSERAVQLLTLLADESMSDLGFLALALRKFATRVEDGGERHVCGSILSIVTAKEYDAFLTLATALQAYQHYKPSKLSSRRGELRVAVEGIQAAVETAAGRRVIPDELYVTEATCSTPLGRAFRGLRDTGRVRCLTAAVSPVLGQRIHFIAAADRDYARCAWQAST